MDEKKTVAENIAKLRISLGLTQAQLGEALNYSDKSVSKWERGESIPDVFVLKQIADMAGVSVDYLLSSHAEDVSPVTAKPERHYSYLFITLTVLAGIAALATTAFVVMWLADAFSWISFLCALPVGLITFLVLNSIWGKRSHNLYIISALMWSIICVIYAAALEKNWWQLFLLGIPAQIIIIFSFLIRNKPATKE